MVTRERLLDRSEAAFEAHAVPEAARRCDLWLTLRTRDAGSARVGLTHEQPPVYLHLRSSNLLLALPDEDPGLLDSAAPIAIRLQVTDALGLGLAPSDFGRGVGLCGGAEAGAADGWRCRDANVVGIGDDGREWPLLGPASFGHWLA